MASLKFYSLPAEQCSCRDENNNISRISRDFKRYYKELKKGRNGSDILTEFGYMRTCCRIKFLSMPLEPMIDRSSERVIDNTVNPKMTEDTRDLLPLVEPPSFPMMVSN